MPLSTYQELQEAIVKTANRETDAGFRAAVPDLIALAEAEMRRDVRARAETQTEDISIDEDSYALPCGFDGIVSINGRGGYRTINYVSSDTMDNIAHPTTNSYTISGGMIYFSRAPGDIRMRYMALFTPLSARTRCNWILMKHPDAYLYGALKHAAPYLEDDSRIGVWGGLYANAVEAINKQAIAQQFGGPLKMQSDRVDGQSGYTRSTSFIFPVQDSDPVPFNYAEEVSP